MGTSVLSLGFPSDLTLYKLLTDWGSAIGGILAWIAGVAAYIGARQAAKMQVKADQGREDREIEALRKSLATEVRQVVGHAFAAHKSLKRLATTATPSNPITARMVEDSSRVASAVVYPSSASKIGALAGSAAMDVVIVYNTIDVARQAAASLTRSRTPDNIAPVTVATVAGAFLNACQYAAQEVFPKLKTGVAVHDDRDVAFARMIGDETADWNKILKQWPKQDSTSYDG